MTQETVRIPDGHSVEIVPLGLEPGVRTTRGGAIIANLGTAGDDPDRELDSVLADVERAVASAREVDVVNVEGRLWLGDLFVPREPPTGRAWPFIAWGFHAGAAASIMTSARRRDALFGAIERIRGGIHSACLVETTPAVIALARGLLDRGVQLRSPDSSHAAHGMLLEVARSDGRTLCVGTGKPYPVPPAQVSFDGREPIVTYRSPRLRAIFTAGGDATAAIANELLTRAMPAFVMRDPRNPQNLALRTFNGVSTLPVYADATAVQWAAVDMKLEPGTCEPGPIDLGAMIDNLAKGDLALSVGLYRDRQTPMYAVIPSPVVKQLARDRRR